MHESENPIDNSVEVASSVLVLVVDDDITIRTLACESLAMAGFATAEAGDGREALDAFERLRPDAILMDVMMPEMDGYAACEELRRRPEAANTPIVIMTAHDDVESINRAYHVGATDFISKPLNAGILGHRLRYVLRGSRNVLRLWKSEARLADAQRIASVGNWELDVARNEISGSAEFYRILGFDPETEILLLDAIVDRVDPEDRRLFSDSMEQALEGRTELDINYRIALPEGEPRVVHQHARVTTDAEGNAKTVVGTLQDITELKKKEEKIHYLAYYDMLTGLANRQLFRDRMRQSLRYAARHELNMAVMFVDLDRFKRINDSLGHSAGDLLLKGVADRMKAALRESDVIGRAGEEDLGTVARLGGDEFIVLLSSIVYAEQAARIAQRLLDCLSEPFDLNGHRVIVGASIGIAVYPMDGEDVDELLKHADSAMYHVKDQGRNSYEFFSKSMNASAFEKLVMENELVKALEREEFVVYYQPQVNIRTGEVVCAEALVRWKHPTMGLVQPARFLPLAQEVGMIAAIDEWVLREVCTQHAVWRKEDVSPPRVAVNMSNQFFWRPKLGHVIRDILRDTMMSPGDLEVELTEGIIMDSRNHATEVVDELSKTGLRLSLDDFGTGSSSLSCVHALPARSIKIDGSFVRNLPDSENQVAITKAILAMAGHLKKVVIAEGVETQEQLDFLKANGCDIVQGYLYSPPLPADEYVAFLEEQRQPALVDA